MNKITQANVYFDKKEENRIKVKTKVLKVAEDICLY